MKKSTVIVVVGGREVRGNIIERKRFDISVLLLDDVLPLELSQHQPTFARAFLPDFRGRYGTRTAERLLTEITPVVDYVRANADALTADWAEIRQQLSDAEVAPLDRAALRRQLRAGQIDQRRHQRILSDHRCRETEAGLLADKIRSQFFRRIPSDVDKDTEEQLIAFFEARLVPAVS